MRAALTGAALVAALGLGACENRDRAAAVGGLCKAFPKDAAAPADPAAAVDDCLHRWGYALARAEDHAGTVAKAAVAACGQQLTRWNQQALSGPAPEGGGQALSLLTGEPMTPIAAHADFAENRALVYVVEARAGNCPAPKFEARNTTAANTSP